MPIIKSAIKKMRQDVKKTARNDHYRRELKNTIKKLKKAITQQKVNEIPNLLKASYSIIDKSLKKKLIKKNTAARKKSSVARAVASLTVKPA